MSAYSYKRMQSFYSYHHSSLGWDGTPVAEYLFLKTKSLSALRLFSSILISHNSLLNSYEIYICQNTGSCFADI